MTSLPAIHSINFCFNVDIVIFKCLALLQLQAFNPNTGFQDKGRYSFFCENKIHIKLICTKVLSYTHIHINTHLCNTRNCERQLSNYSFFCNLSENSKNQEINLGSRTQSILSYTKQSLLLVLYFLNFLDAFRISFQFSSTVHILTIHPSKPTYDKNSPLVSLKLKIS